MSYKCKNWNGQVVPTRCEGCKCPQAVAPLPPPAMTDADLRAEILYAQTRLGNVLRVLEERDRR